MATAKFESDSDLSDEEWLPGVREEKAAFDNHNKFIVFKPKKLHVSLKRTAHTCTLVTKKSTTQIKKSDGNEISDDQPKKKAVKKSIKFRVTRSIRKQCYKEEVPDDDHYIFCEECQDYYYGECPSHKFKIIEDSDNKAESAPDAMKSLPEHLYVKNSLIPNLGVLGVFSKVKLEGNTRFGPYKGTRVDAEDLKDEMNTSYMWEIVQGGKIQYCIGHDTSRSNWMRYVNCSRCENEQNLVAFQYRGDIYYRVCKPIEANTELLVWYGDEYAEQLGIPLFEEEQTEDKIGGHTCKHCGRMYMYQHYLDVHLERCPVLASDTLWECKDCYAHEE